MQHFYIFSRLQKEVNSPCLEQSQTIHQSEPHASFRLRSALLANGLAFGDRGLQGERTIAKLLVVIFRCRSCRAISAWGHETVYLFHGREIERQIDNNRGCRGKKKEGREEDQHANASCASICIQTHPAFFSIHPAIRRIVAAARPSSCYHRWKGV